MQPVVRLSSAHRAERTRERACLCLTRGRRLVCTGSLTNAAVLVTLFPEVVPMVDVVIMGGAMGQGNTVRRRALASMAGGRAGEGGRQNKLTVSAPALLRAIPPLVVRPVPCATPTQGPVAEFNIQTDPEAAHVVFNSGVSLTMVPLEASGMGCRRGGSLTMRCLRTPRCALHHSGTADARHTHLPFTCPVTYV